jgi:hypothetical protein
VTLLDCRDADEWTAASSSPCGVDFCPRKGRLTGSVWLEWYALMTEQADGTSVFRDPEEIRRLASGSASTRTPTPTPTPGSPGGCPDRRRRRLSRPCRSLPAPSPPAPAASLRLRFVRVKTAGRAAGRLRRCVTLDPQAGTTTVTRLTLPPREPFRICPHLTLTGSTRGKDHVVTTNQQATLGGIDAEGLERLSCTAKADPSTGRRTLRTRTVCETGFRNLTSVRDLAPVLVGEPPALLGEDAAPNPSEIALAALGSCMSVGLPANIHDSAMRWSPVVNTSARPVEVTSSQRVG